MAAPRSSSIGFLFSRSNSKTDDAKTSTSVRSSTSKIFATQIQLNAAKKPPDLPPKSKFQNMYDEEKIKALSLKNSCHPVLVIRDKITTFVKVYIKGGSNGSIGEVFSPNYAGSRRPIMDAAVNEISRYLLGERAAKTCALFAIIEGYHVFHSIETEEVKDFISQKEKPLSNADVTIDCLINKRATFLELDTIDEEYRINKKDLKSLPAEVRVRDIFSKEDLIKYRYLKDVIQCRMLDYFIMNDDPSPDNAGNGHFDGDCDTWNIKYHYKITSKLASPFDAHLRNPNYNGKNSFVCTTRDTESLPALHDATPSKWFAGTNKYTNDYSIKTSARAFFENDFTPEQKKFNASLEHNELVQFLKYSFFLKLLCLDPKIFSLLFGLHIPESIPSLPTVPNTSGKVLKDLCKIYEDRHKDFCLKFKASAKFKKFLEDYCADRQTISTDEEPFNPMLNNIKQQVKAHNIRMSEEIPGAEEKGFIVNLEKFCAKYESYKEEVFAFHKQHEHTPIIRVIP